MDDKFRIIYTGCCDYIEYKYTVNINQMRIPVWFFKNHYDKKDIIHKSDYIIITDENIGEEDVYNYLSDKNGILKRFEKRYFKDDNYYNFFTPTEFKRYCMNVNYKYSKKLDIQPRKIIYYNSKKHDFGCCGSMKEFKINKKLIFYDKNEIIDTICHEMVHSLRGYRHHKRSFWHKLDWLLKQEN